ncbi:MAG: hypothetical protein EPO68_03180 [Planctomycetota bacterium]|nr:MAG: hypothetical protein EPO68_03180 [Planctomycetota bacterium]
MGRRVQLGPGDRGVRRAAARRAARQRRGGSRDDRARSRQRPARRGGRDRTGARARRRVGRQLDLGRRDAARLRAARLAGARDRAARALARRGAAPAAGARRAQRVRARRVPGTRVARDRRVHGLRVRRAGVTAHAAAERTDAERVVAERGATAPIAPPPPTSAPLSVTRKFAPTELAALRRRAIFECGKWDPQFADHGVLADYALVLTDDAWRELAALAEQLARETLAAERELMQRPELHGELGLPRAIRAALSEAHALGEARGAARTMRFDFHWTSAGWRISEVNSDVPGGFIEAGGITRIAAELLGLAPCGDPTAALADALAAATPAGGAIGLVHATAYTDDRQVMVQLGRALEARERRTCLLDPTQLEWQDGVAHARTEWFAGRLDALARFYPAEWLANLPRRSGWRAFFRGSRTPQANPGSALLVQSKRFPLAWDRLTAPLPTWRAMLPETRSPRDVDWRADPAWLVKPALGRVGEEIGLRDVVEPKQWRAIARSARWSPSDWVAQRRFDALALDVHGERAWPCIGVYVIDGRAAGIYGRIARRALVDAEALDVAVLVNRSVSSSPSVSSNRSLLSNRSVSSNRCEQVNP